MWIYELTILGLCILVVVLVFFFRYSVSGVETGTYKVIGLSPCINNVQYQSQQCIGGKPCRRGNTLTFDTIITKLGCSLNETFPVIEDTSRGLFCKKGICNFYDNGRAVVLGSLNHTEIPLDTPKKLASGQILTRRYNGWFLDNNKVTLQDVLIADRTYIKNKNLKSRSLERSDYVYADCPSKEFHTLEDQYKPFELHDFQIPRKCIYGNCPPEICPVKAFNFANHDGYSVENQDGQLATGRNFSCEFINLEEGSLYSQKEHARINGAIFIPVDEKIFVFLPDLTRGWLNKGWTLDNTGDVYPWDEFLQQNKIINTYTIDKENLYNSELFRVVFSKTLS